MQLRKRSGGQFKPTLSSQDDRVTDLHAAGLHPCLQIQIRTGIQIQIHIQFKPTLYSQDVWVTDLHDAEKDSTHLLVF